MTERTEQIHSCSYYCERHECIKRQRDKMRDAQTADARDAARYRFLVETADGDIYMEHQPGDKAQLDAAIDAAIAAIQREEK